MVRLSFKNDVFWETTLRWESVGDNKSLLVSVCVGFFFFFVCCCCCGRRVSWRSAGLLQQRSVRQNLPWTSLSPWLNFYPVLMPGERGGGPRSSFIQGCIFFFFFLVDIWVAAEKGWRGKRINYSNLCSTYVRRFFLCSILWWTVIRLPETKQRQTKIRLETIRAYRKSEWGFIHYLKTQTNIIQYTTTQKQSVFLFKYGGGGEKLQVLKKKRVKL